MKVKVIQYTVTHCSIFLSDPSPIIALAMLVTKSLTALTNSLLFSKLDVTLACEDAYSKLVEVLTVADVDAENRVGNSLLQIWKLRSGYEA